MSIGKIIAMEQRNQARDLQLLLGLIGGMTCDRRLTDEEITYLDIWLRDHPAVTGAWPGNIIAARIAEAVSDGVITETERAYLLETLNALSGESFMETGSAAPEVAALPIDDAAPIVFESRTFCFTGNFVFGTRAECQRIVEKLGGVAADNITRKLDYLVIGSIVSENWANSSFGRKIEKAASLQQDGCPVKMITESRWTQAL